MRDTVSFLEEASGIERHLHHQALNYPSYKLQRYLLSLSLTEDSLGQHQQSLKMLDEHANLRRHQYYTRPISRTLYSLMESLQDLSDALHESSESEGLAPLEEAVALAQRHPTYRHICTLLPVSLEHLGDFHRGVSNHEGACAAYQMVREFWKASKLKRSERDTRVLVAVLRSQHKSFCMLGAHEEAEEVI